MRTIILRGDRTTCEIRLGVQAGEFDHLIVSQNALIITDTRVFGLYGHLLSGHRVVKVRPGERSKSLATVNGIYRQLLDAGIDRSSLIIGFGGGVVCDIAGFVASTYLRGLPFAFVPTTLLAQVDASVGGKNGLNFGGYKNIIGTINQPSSVLCDFSVLETLPRKERRNGYAEVIKHALIGDSNLLSTIEQRYDEMLALKPDLVEEVVHRSLNVKTGIVARDETEQGERRKLNFGHTIGHALELTLGLSHGEAVSIGMVSEAGLSEKRGLIGGDETKRIRRVLEHFGLPVRCKGNRQAIMAAIMKDKKRDAEQIHCILLRGIGDALVERIPISELKEVVDDLC